jgi:hypothetical protein
MSAKSNLKLRNALPGGSWPTAAFVDGWIVVSGSGWDWGGGGGEGEGAGGNTGTGIGSKGGVSTTTWARFPDPPEDMFLTFQTVAPVRRGGKSDSIDQMEV